MMRVLSLSLMIVFYEGKFEGSQRLPVDDYNLL